MAGSTGPPYKAKQLGLYAFLKGEENNVVDTGYTHFRVMNKLQVDLLGAFFEMIQVVSSEIVRVYIFLIKCVNIILIIAPYTEHKAIVNFQFSSVRSM